MPRSFEPVRLPALGEQRGESYVRLVELMQRLLAPDGCPWDREQSYASLRRYVLEEAAEVADAIDVGDLEELKGELGDLLLQVVFLGELGRRDGVFGPDDVVAGIVDKLVRRHPHVFGDAVASDADAVRDNWERIKVSERRARGAPSGLLSSVPRSLPALIRAERVGEKAAKVGFDWPDASGPRRKLDEELGELDDALATGDRARVEEELGDALFALVNVARHAGIDPEAALGGTVDRFVRRFARVEQRVDEAHGGFGHAELSLAELDAYWEDAKAREES